MTLEDRIRFLLRVAKRMEGEGDHRAAVTFRQMADEARPVGPSPFSGLRFPLRHGID